MKHQSAARTSFFDAALERHLSGMDQLVILGAGLDTRPYRLPAGVKVRCFEIEAPAIQSFKARMLEKAGVDASRVTYVPADFLKDDWFEELVEAGFEPGRPSFFVWESVTMFLDRAAVESFLRKIAASGSVVAFDYLSVGLIESRSLLMRYARAMLGMLGEAYTFGIDNTPPVQKRLAEFPEPCGLVLEEQRSFGKETDRALSVRGRPGG
jgi:methyltransferase (TIGR00027 family)